MVLNGEILAFLTRSTVLSRFLRNCLIERRLNPAMVALVNEIVPESPGQKAVRAPPATLVHMGRRHVENFRLKVTHYNGGPNLRDQSARRSRGGQLVA